MTAANPAPTPGDAVCSCGHVVSKHIGGWDCIALIYGGRDDPLRCDCQGFVLAGTQPSLFEAGAEATGGGAGR